jgi:hypothetical protein
MVSVGSPWQFQLSTANPIVEIFIPYRTKLDVLRIAGTSETKFCGFVEAFGNLINVIWRTVTRATELRCDRVQIKQITKIYLAG